MGPFTYTATLSHLTSRRVNQTQLPQISAALTGHNIAKSPQCDYACVVRPGSQARQRPASWLWAGPTWNALLAEHPVISWQCVSIQHKIHKCLYIYTHIYLIIYIYVYIRVYIYIRIYILCIYYIILLCMLFIVICTSETHGFCGTAHLARLHGSCLFRLGRKRYPAEGDTAWRCSSSYKWIYRIYRIYIEDYFDILTINHHH